MESQHKVILYGTGGYFRDCLPFVSKYFDIVAITESNPTSEILNGYRVIRPQQLDNESYDFVVIMSEFVEEITHSLLNHGVANQKIKTVEAFGKFIEFVKRDILNQCATACSLTSNGSKRNSSKQAIRFVINSLGGGGAEKALTNLLDRLGKTKFDIDVLVLFKGDIYRSSIPTNVNTIFLSDTVKNSTCLKLALKHASRKELATAFGNKCYGADIAFLEGWSTRIVSGCDCHYKLAWCHTNLQTNHWTKNYCFNTLDEELSIYQNFDSIVFVSNDALLGFSALFREIESKRLVVIPNLISIQSKSFSSDTHKPRDHFTFLSIGRLAHVKGFARLIDAFSKLNSSVPLKLLIVGDGPERQNLEKQISELGLDDKVLLMGFHSEPFSIAFADCFVSSSYTEGHPLAVAEALMNGLPVLATSCGGNVEMLDQGLSGLLVENSADGLIDGMRQIVESKPLRQSLAQKALEAKVNFTDKEAYVQMLRLIGKGLSHA